MRSHSFQSWPAFWGLAAAFVFPLAHAGQKKFDGDNGVVRGQLSIEAKGAVIDKARESRPGTWEVGSTDGSPGVVPTEIAGSERAVAADIAIEVGSMVEISEARGQVEAETSVANVSGELAVGTGDLEQVTLAGSEASSSGDAGTSEVAMLRSSAASHLTNSTDGTESREHNASLVRVGIASNDSSNEVLADPRMSPRPSSGHSGFAAEALVHIGVDVGMQPHGLTRANPSEVAKVHLTANPSALVALTSNSSEACLDGAGAGTLTSVLDAVSSDLKNYPLDMTQGTGAVAMLYALEHASALNDTVVPNAFDYSSARCVPDGSGSRVGCHSIGCQCRSFERCFAKFTHIDTSDEAGLTVIDVGACGISAWASVVLLGGPLAFCIAFCMYVQFAYFELSVQIMLPHQFPRMVSASGF